LGDSFASANHGAVILEVGGSNGQGEPGTGAPPLAKPASVTYIDDGAVVASYATLARHGAAIYMLDELVNVLGHSAPITYLNSCIASTDVDVWLSTHAATAIGHCTSAGVRPAIVILDNGGSDAQGQADADSFPGDCTDLFEMFATKYGAGIARIIIGLTAVQDATYTHADQVRAAQAALAASANDCCMHFSTEGAATFDGAHRTVAANEVLGRAIGRALFASGLLP